jgi:hypothetical protein
VRQKAFGHHRANQPARRSVGRAGWCKSSFISSIVSQTTQQQQVGLSPFLLKAIMHFQKFSPTAKWKKKILVLWAPPLISDVYAESRPPRVGWLVGWADDVSLGAVYTYESLHELPHGSPYDLEHIRYEPTPISILNWTRFNFSHFGLPISGNVISCLPCLG